MKKNLLFAAVIGAAVVLASCGSSEVPQPGSEGGSEAASVAATSAAETSAAESIAKEEGGSESTEGKTEASKEGEGEGTASSYAGKTLIMATNAEFPPYEYHDGNDIVGIDVEIAQAIAMELDADFVVTDIAFDSIIPEVQSDKADFGAAGMTVTEDRLTQVDFSDTYATAVQSVIVLSDSEIKTIDDLSGKLIGVQQGTTGDIYATDDYGDENIQRFPKGADAIQALSSGKIDAVIIDNNPAKVFVSQNEGLKILDTSYAEEQYAICVKKGNEELLKGINQAISKLKSSGELDKIVAKYIKAE